jgi:cobalt-zinc-cadmium efflux system outer membrane protein
MVSKPAWPRGALPCAAAALLGALLPQSALHAQTALAPSIPPASAPAATSATPLNRLFEASWQRSPYAAGQSARRAAAQAGREGARRLTPEPASVTLAHRSDQPTRNEGQREYEAELAVPLWLPGQRSAAMQLGDTDAQLAELSIELERLKLAQEIRQRWWALVQAANTLALERRRVADAQQLAADMQRRLKAGDVARTDANQAQALVQLALIAQTEAEQAVDAQLATLQSASGLGAGLLLQLAERTPQTEAARSRAAEAPHPELAAARLAQEAAQAKLRLAAASGRANPSLSLGVIRERDAFGDAHKNTLRLGVTLPFASAPAAAAQTESARAQALEADSLLSLAGERVQMQERLARRGVDRARTMLTAAEQRVALTRDTSALLTRAWRLGEIDLATRLRADAEHVEAQRAFIQAQVQLGRAVSELNQSLGLLP